MSNPPRALLEKLYFSMVLTRAFEERVAKLHAEGLIRGSVHLCVGQEATGAGACAALRSDDYLTCTYRGHGQALCKGLSPRAALAELCGRETGCCKGRGGSMHLADPSVGLLGENGIVGAGLAIACGAALSSKLQKQDRVALTIFGEGATTQGVSLESLNLAAAWDLPVIFLCENNVYAEMTPISKETKVEKMAARADGVGMPSMQVDGNDVLAVYDAVTAAALKARLGKGPTFIEAHTYRFVGHMIGDREVYRTKEEVDERRKADPIPRFRSRLQQQFGLSSNDLDALDEGALAAVDDAESFARSSNFPDPRTANDFIYA